MVMEEKGKVPVMQDGTKTVKPSSRPPSLPVVTPPKVETLKGPPVIKSMDDLKKAAEGLKSPPKGMPNIKDGPVGIPPSGGGNVVPPDPVREALLARARGGVVQPSPAMQQMHQAMDQQDAALVPTGVIEVSLSALATFLQMPPEIQIVDVDIQPAPPGDNTRKRLHVKVRGVGLPAFVTKDGVKGVVPLMDLPLHYIYACRHWQVCWDAAVRQGSGFKQFRLWPDDGREVPVSSLPTPR